MTIIDVELEGFDEERWEHRALRRILHNQGVLMSAETDLQAVVSGLEASVTKLAAAVTALPNADAVPAAAVEAAVASLQAVGSQLDAIVAAITPAPAESVPTVTGVSPNTGSVAGGESVTISGSGFTGATNVNFGGDAASFTVESDTSTSAVAPAASAGPGTVDVVVTTPAGTSESTAADQYTTS